MAGKILNSAGEATLVVDEILVSELRIKVVDCRTNQVMENAQTSRIKITNGSQTIEREFDRANDIQNIDSSNKIKGSMLALQKLGYETEEKATGADKLPKKYDDTWRGYYNQYWSDRIPDFEELTQGNPSETMMTYMIDEYNHHRATDDNGLLRLQIPNALLDDKAVTVEVGFFNFPVVLERVRNDTRTNSVLRTSDSTDSETGFSIKWNQENRQSTSWKGDFGWKIYKGTDTCEFKYSEEFTIKNDTDKFETFDPESCSQFHDEGTIDSHHYVLFALQWCQPIYDFIDDPDPEAAHPTRSNEYAFVNMKHDNEWIRGINMHIPTKHTAGSGPYYGIFDTISPYPRPQMHQGVDLYSGEEGKNLAFAVHAGELKICSGYGYGYRAYLLFGGKGDPCFHYAHLREQAKAKGWVMAGEKVGISGLTRNVVDDGMSTFKDEPYHLHLEFIKSSTSTTTPPILGEKVVFSEIANISPGSNAKYSAPTGANAFLFQGNRLPLLLPCKSVYCNHSENGKDSGYLNGCKFGNGNNIAYKTCYAVQRYPYLNNLLLSNITDMVSNDLHPNTGIIRYICPHILSTGASKKAQLQAKIKFVHVNKNRFPPDVFNHNNESVFNSFFTVTTESLIVDGILGDNSKTAIKNIIRAYYYSQNNDKKEKERILSDDNSKIDSVKIAAFINKYIDGTDISTDDSYSVINDFYNWFDSFDFNNMCWNNPI